MRVEISGKDYKYCDKKSAEYRCNKKNGVFGRGLINSKDDPYRVTRTGLLGEMAFAQYLGLPIRFEYMEHGDEYDFKVGEITIDVKTASRDYGAVLVRCISEKGNFILDPCDIYVGCYIVNEDREKGVCEIEIVGWTPSSIFNTLDPVPAIYGKHKNYSIPFASLKPLSSLKKALKITSKNKNPKTKRVKKVPSIRVKKK